MKGTPQERQWFLKLFSIIWATMYQIGGSGIFIFEFKALSSSSDDSPFRFVLAFMILSISVGGPVFAWRAYIVEYAIQESLHDATLVRQTYRSMWGFELGYGPLTGVVAGVFVGILFYLPFFEQVAGVMYIIFCILFALGLITNVVVRVRVLVWKRWRKQLHGLLMVPFDFSYGRIHHYPINDVTRYL